MAELDPDLMSLLLLMDRNRIFNRGHTRTFPVLSQTRIHVQSITVGSYCIVIIKDQLEHEE